MSRKRGRMDGKIDGWMDGRMDRHKTEQNERKMILVGVWVNRNIR